MAEKGEHRSRVKCRVKDMRDMKERRGFGRGRREKEGAVLRKVEMTGEYLGEEKSREE